MFKIIPYTNSSKKNETVAGNGTAHAHVGNIEIMSGVFYDADLDPTLNHTGNPSAGEISCSFAPTSSGDTASNKYGYEDVGT